MPRHHAGCLDHRALGYMAQIVGIDLLELECRSYRHACLVAVDSQSIVVGGDLGTKAAGHVGNLQSMVDRTAGPVVDIGCIDRSHTAELQELHRSLAGHIVVADVVLRTGELRERRNPVVVAGIDVGLADSSDHDIEVDHIHPRALESRRMGTDCIGRTS